MPRIYTSMSPEERALKRRASHEKYRQAHPDRRKEAVARYRARNIDRVRAEGAIRSAAQRKANPEKAREAVRKCTHRTLGIPTPTRVRPILCECCGGVPEKRAFSVDHCHVSGVFRGWLCSKCNAGIGMLGDSIDGLMKAVRYLERAASQENQSTERGDL
jgi:Recombination endonuclease VII